MLSTDSGIRQVLHTCTCGLESAESGLHGLPARGKESSPHPKRRCRQGDPVPPPLPPTPLPHLCPRDALCQSASLLCRRRHRVRLLLQTFCRFFHLLPVCPVTWQGVSPGGSARVTLCLLAWAPPGFGQGSAREHGGGGASALSCVLLGSCLCRRKTSLLCSTEGESRGQTGPGLQPEGACPEPP